MPKPSEQWRSINDFPNYEVSNQGRVRRLAHFKYGTASTRQSGYILTQNSTPRTYRQVHLFHHGKSLSQMAHRLVLTAFVGQCPVGHEANHRNGIKTDNRLNNLEWVTPSQNKRHAVRSRLAYIGERNGRAKLTANDVRRIRQELTQWSGIRGGLAKLHPERATYSLTAIARRYGVSRSAIAFIRNAQHWASVTSFPTLKSAFI